MPYRLDRKCVHAEKSKDMKIRRLIVKKYISIMLAVMLMIVCLSACGNGREAAAGGSDKIQIVTTIFPEYDWVKNVLGENPAGAEVTMLLDNGVDLHSYQPTAEDIMKISTCDLFIYVGGESDEWVEEALKEVTNKDMIVINLLEELGDAVKEEEVVEGMQEEEHEHGDGDLEEEEHEDEDHHEEEVEFDEHVWLSLRNSSVLIQSISDALCKVDPANADTYNKNASAYRDKLNELDSKFQTAVSKASVDTLLFGDRFPFRYLVDDYGLSYYAAFVGCSAETEASFETIAYLAQKVDDLGLHSVLTIEGTDHRIAETIVENTKEKNQQILTMDSMQSTTSKDVAAGAAYLSIMEKDLEVLTEALK